MRTTPGVFPLALLLLAAPVALAAQRPVAIRGGTVIPVDGPRIERGTVLMRDGRIAAVGRDVPIPADAEVLDATGKYLLPGLVDAMSHYGIAAEDLNETTAPSTPGLRALEAYYPFGAFSDGEPFGRPRARDLDMEAMGKLLRREIPARVQANRTTEIRAALALASEFGFDLILDSGISAGEMATTLASARVPVVLGPVAHRIGSPTVGKDADVIILDGPPLSVTTWVERAYVGGEPVYDRPSPPQEVAR